jgi:hypothetical protein
MPCAVIMIAKATRITIDTTIGTIEETALTKIGLAAA